MSCKGVCIRYKVKLSSTFKGTGGGHYRKGHKRCQMCEIFMKVDGLFCPCCGFRMRTKPRSKKYKAKLKQHIENATIGNVQ